MSAELPFLAPHDLAPGDRRKDAVYPTGLRLHTVSLVDDPCFEIGYRFLDAEFGPLDEMESREVLAKRLKWHPAHPEKGDGQLYRMMLLFVGDECVAARDHSAMMVGNTSDVVVHMSHVLISPKWRRKGLVSILRALPLQTARECASLLGKTAENITLFAEMDPLDLSIPKNKIRRVSYEKANFRAVDGGIGYTQPDFRLPEVIDADPNGATPIPLQLLMRRVDREAETSISRDELYAFIKALYAMYSIDCREADMASCWDWLEQFKANSPDIFHLIPPTSE